MTGFALRLLALLLRFACPLAVLSISGATELGRYYLATTLLTTVVMFIALETAIPFSAAYLRATTDAMRRRRFTDMLITQVVIAGPLSLLPTAIAAATTDLPMGLVALLPALLISEACASEVGRFFWNIGRSDLASRRDLIRAVALLFAVLAGIWTEHTLIGWTTLLLLTASNLLLVVTEAGAWGDGARMFLRVRRLGRRRFLPLVMRIRRSLVFSGPQVLHGQVLALQPLLERMAIEKRIGLDLVGSFAFHSSLVQTGSSLLLLPWVAKTRQKILADREVPHARATHRAALVFAGVSLLVSSAAAVITYASVPLLTQLLRKSVETGVGLTLAAAAAGAANSYCAALSPLFAPRQRWLAANAITLMNMLPLLVALSPAGQFLQGSALAVFGAVASAALLQVALRLLFSWRRC